MTKNAKAAGKFVMKLTLATAQERAGVCLNWRDLEGVRGSG